MPTIRHDSYLDSLLQWLAFDLENRTIGAKRHQVDVGYCQDHHQLRFINSQSADGMESCSCNTASVMRQVWGHVKGSTPQAALATWRKHVERVESLVPQARNNMLYHEERVLWLAYVELMYPLVVKYRTDELDYSSDDYEQLNDLVNCLRQRNNSARPDPETKVHPGNTMLCTAHKRVGEMVPLRKPESYNDCHICVRPRPSARSAPIASQSDL